MPIEQPKKYSEEEIRKIGMNKRVERLKDNEDDAPWESPIYDLAEKENEARKGKEANLKSLRRIFKNRKLSSKEKAIVDKEADQFSDETLGKLEAEKEKFIDDLTGLKNKNALEAEIPPILRLKKREKEKCSLLAMDVDSFKKFNDTHGHPFGDQVLKLVADILKKSCRESDLVYRAGGDEFVVLLPDAAIENVKDVVKRIMVNLEMANKDKILDTDIELGLSFGISIVDYGEGDLNKDIDELKKEADAALYYSKNTGKNRVSVFKEGMELENNK